MNSYEEYAIIEAKIKALKATQTEMRVKILEDMVNSKEKKIVTPVGSFSVSQRKTWTYTDKVTETEEKLKALMAKEESTGDATYVEAPSLKFTPVKL